MASLEELRNERIKKLEIMRGRGINPYPISSRPDTDLLGATKSYSKLSKKKSVTLAGRITAIRGQGGIIFFDINDGTGVFQVMLKRGETDEKLLQLFSEVVDIGDFVEVNGKFFLTKRKEKTILASSWMMLEKSLRPMPDKWHGLENVEERFRKRYLDLISSDEVKNRFVIRSKIISGLRNFLDKAGYMEVETPMLQHLPGGATAIPFKTHHNALDIDLYLRIAPELYLKKLLVGGMGRVYELARNFRNEGIDVTHNPEFTMLEFYEAYSDAERQMGFVEDMIKQIVKETSKKPEITYDGQAIHFKNKFTRISYFELLKRYALITHPEKAGREELSLKAKQFALAVAETDAPEKIMDNIFKKACRPKLIQPTFVTDYPVAFSPFAKRKENNPDFIDRFQLIIGGLELVNAFSELNDALEQRKRYLEQDNKRRGGEAEVSPSDENYLEALEYGMPPAGGVGVGIDRLVMLLTDQKNIREVILFPTLRPK